MGVCAKTIVVPIVELQKEETLLQADVILVGEVFDNQLLMGLVEMYKSDRGFMRLIWDESMRETIDQEMDKLMRESEPWRQQEALMQVEERLKERFVVLFLYHSLQQSSHHSALAGVSLNAWGFVDYKDIWFKP
jgi:MarR-like DNA-binding transcriptional regulator SgrR of sgrS sRNA